MTYDPNVFGYVDGQPTYSRDEFIYKKRRRGPITDDAELVAFAEKVTSGWYNAGWHQTFTTYYLGDYALSEPLDSMTIHHHNHIRQGGKRMNMIDITPVINAVIALLAAGVSVFLIPWIKSKTTDAQRKELLEWVKIGVAAAEQLYKGQGRGEEKKKYVLEFLASMGFTVDEEAINAAIEAAVNQLNGGNLPLE